MRVNGSARYFRRVQQYAARMKRFRRIDRSISLSRRDLPSPQVKITRSTAWEDSVNPWKEPGKLPSDFVTNDDFCPGCGLELKSLPVERNNLWIDVFQRDLQEGFDPAQASDSIKPGLLAFRGWGLERQ